MPSIRVIRLCQPRQKEVQQPIKLHRARPSHAKKPLRRHRQGMVPGPCSPSCTMFKLDGCMAKQDLKLLFQSSCGYPLIKRRPCKGNLPQGVKSPSTHAMFSHTHVRVDDDESPSADLHGANVGTYRQLQCPKRRMKLDGKAKSPSTHVNFSHHRMHVDDYKNPFDDDFNDANVVTYRRLPSSKGDLDSEDDDYKNPFDDKVLNSSLFADPQLDKAVESEFTEMHGNDRNKQASVRVSCFNKVTATKHEYQMLNSKKKSNLHPKSPNIHSYTTRMDNKSNIPIDAGDAESCNINVFTKQEPIKRGCTSSGSTMYGDYTTMSPQSLILSKQRASFPYDGIFYQKPKIRVNAPRRARKLEPASYPARHTIKHRHAPPRLSKESNARKVHFHDSHDSTTRSLLPSHDGSELPTWSSPLKSNVGLCLSPPSQEEGDKLEHFAAHESAETTRDIMKCLRLAENINNEVATSLNALYQQGEQTRTAHEHTLEIDHNLSAGEKILGNFGGFFSKTWKPVKTRTISGPKNAYQRHSVSKNKAHADKWVSGRGKNHVGNLRSDLMAQTQLPWQAKLQIEEREQDEALTDLSNMVSNLKKMSLDMGIEISRQTEALDPFQDDVVELSQRLKRANLRGRSLLAQ